MQKPGLDTIPLIVPIHEFGRENHRGLPHLPQQPIVKSAPRSRLMISWWDQQISVWRILKRRADADIRNVSPETDGPQGRKLVAKVMLQGEESITSADLSLDGSILVVSTMAALTFLQLRSKANSLKVQKLKAPVGVTGTGAKSIHITPDKKWLAIIRADDNIQLYRVITDTMTRIELLPKAVDLRRLPRDFIGTKGQLDSLGKYNRCITQLAFSSDSRILAVADILGYIDTWVLEGHEDLTQADSTVPQKKATASSASESDEDSDEEDHTTIIFGQHWIRNPFASLLIKLPAAPLVFTFRPSSLPPPNTSMNGTIAPHPTRHTPHPHSHDLPHGEDRLLILTAENQMYEFNVLAGKLSDWSRRNPTKSLPKDFRDLRDRAMGAVWDVLGENERVWIHGANWLWMFDLSRDMPAIEAKDAVPGLKGNGAVAQLKRKRGSDVDENVSAKRSRHDTGAGSKIPDSKLEFGIGRKIRKIKSAEGDGQSISIIREPSPSSDEEDEESNPGNESQLMKLKRSGSHTEDDEDLENGNGGDNTSNEDRRIAKRAPNEKPPYWHTFKYRPILGMVPLGGDTDDEGDGDGDDDKATAPGLEVALVERPLWDVELAPTFHGNQEWDQ